MPAHPEIFTVGHSTHPFEFFVALLGDARVEAIADVRRYPGSRRNPQFGAAALSASLGESGIGYHAFGKTLGGRRESGSPGDPDRPDNSAWKSSSFRAYADHMSSDEFVDGLAALESLARSRRTAIMCAESHPSRCHRRLIADALLAREWPVLHLLANGSLEAHALTPHGVVADGRVSYPGQPSLGI